MLRDGVKEVAGALEVPGVEDPLLQRRRGGGMAHTGRFGVAPGYAAGSLPAHAVKGERLAELKQAERSATYL